MFLLSSLLASHLQALKKTLFRVLLGHLCDTTAFKMCWFLCLKTAKILVLAVHRGLFSPDIHSVSKAPRVEGRKDSLASCSLGTQAQTNQPWREGDGCGALQMWSDLQIDLQRQSAKHIRANQAFCDIPYILLHSILMGEMFKMPGEQGWCYLHAVLFASAQPVLVASVDRILARGRCSLTTRFWEYTCSSRSL